MILDEMTRLERFRRIAKIYDINSPEENMLPVQEVEYLRGHINANVYLEAEPWMCPTWVALTRKSIDTEKELVTDFRNTQYRNWSNIGGVGARRYGISCSRGLVVPRFGLGSIDFWVLENNELIFPALIGKDGPQMKLVSTEDQLYEWKTQIKSVEFVRLVYHVTKDNSEYIYNEIILRNLGLETTTCSFYLVVRPMSPLGIEPIETAEYDTSLQMVFVNGNLVLIANKKPTAVVMCEGNDIDLPKTVIEMSTQLDVKLSSSTGLATTILRYDVTLSPAGSETVIFGSPLFAVTKNDEIPSFHPNHNDRDRSIGKWFDFAAERIDVTFPDERLNVAFNQATVSLANQAFQVIFPDVSHLKSLSWKERMRVLLALIRSGCIKITENVIAEMISKVDIPDGPLELSTFSPLLLGVHQYYEYTTEAQISGNYIEFFRKCSSGIVDAIKNQMGTDEISLEAESTLIDDTALEHYLVVEENILSGFEDLLWNLAALKSAQKFSKYLRDEEFTIQIGQTITKYQNFVVEKSKEIEHARWIRPTDSAMQQVEREILDVLASVALLQVTEIESGFLEMLNSKIEKRRIVNNLWKFFQPDERYSSHLALRLAHFYVKTKRRDLIEPLLNRVIDFFSDDYHLPDFVDIRTYGGSRGCGESVMAAADFILLMLDMVLFEEGSNLIVLAGVPESWFTSKKPLIVDSLPTRSNKAHIELGTSSNQHQIEISLVDLPEEFEVHVPASVPIPMVKAFGASIVERTSKAASPFLKVVPLSEETVLTFHK